MCLCKSWWRHTASSVSVPLPIHPHPNIPYSHPSALLYSSYVCGLCVQSVLSKFGLRACSAALTGYYIFTTPQCGACMPALFDTVCLCGGTCGMFVVGRLWSASFGFGRDHLSFRLPRPDLAGGPTWVSCRTVNRTCGPTSYGITRRNSSNDWSPAGTAGVWNIFCSDGFPGPSRTAGLPAPLLFVPGRKTVPCCDTMCAVFCCLHSGNL